MTDWYYADADNRRQGPLAAEELTRLHEQGRMGPDTLVWREGLAQWEPLQARGDELGLTAGPAPAAATVAPEVDLADRSPYTPPRAALSQTAGYSAGGEVVYAGFWKRAAALMVDGLVLGVAYYAVLFLATQPQRQQHGFNGATKAILIVFGLLYGVGILGIVLAIAIPAMVGSGG